jgi:hypothetical protein
VGLLGSGDIARRRYQVSQLASVELVEDYKTVAQISTGNDVAPALATLEGRQPPAQVTSLAIRLHVNDPAGHRETVWFHRGKTAEVGSTQYSLAWTEAVRCFSAVGALLAKASRAEAKTADAATSHSPSAPGEPIFVNRAGTAAQVTSNLARYCPMCGAAVGPGHRFCRVCGKDLGALVQ